MGFATPDEITIPVRCAPKLAPCPTCGTKGRRKRTWTRRVRTIAYHKIAWLHITYGEYQARCTCCKYFRTTPADVLPKADYDNQVRQAVLDRILQDGLNVERTRAALKRDFLLELSEGFVYDCLDWQVHRLDLAVHRQTVLARFSGTLCVDELHLGSYTLLLATDPLADLPVAFALVKANDHDHMRRFLKNLKDWGLRPTVVVTDGSNLYPTVLAELWSEARHQLCVFHVLKDINQKVLDAVRRARRGLARRGRAGRKRRRGRRSQAQQARARRRGPTLQEKAHFIWKHRYLIVTRTEALGKQGWNDLVQMFDYLPELRTLWHFTRDVYQLFEAGQKSTGVAQRRRTQLVRDADYQGVPELVEALGMLEKEKFAKMVAFLRSPLGQRVRTNNHVERTNRKLRFYEKVRYKWRRRRTLVRFLVLALDRWWQAARQQAQAAKETSAGAGATGRSPKRTASSTDTIERIRANTETTGGD
jgi:hypothetical protein